MSTKFVRLGAALSLFLYQAAIQAAKLPANDHNREIAFRVGFVEQIVERAYHEEKSISED
jgi:hypothetical protein